MSVFTIRAGFPTITVLDSLYFLFNKLVAHTILLSARIVPLRIKHCKPIQQCEPI